MTAPLTSPLPPPARSLSAAAPAVVPETPTAQAQDPVPVPAGVPVSVPGPVAGADAGAGAGRDEPVKLWLCPNDGLPPAVAGLLAAHWLDAQEQRTASRFLFERDRRQYLLAHTLVRRALALEAGLAEAELVIWRSARGRPFLRPAAGELPRGGAQLDFNLSHAGGYSLLGIVRRHRIGVDVERLEDRDERAITTIVRTFAAPEREWVERAAPGPDRDRRALRVWTLKEAYSKARGIGLGLPFDAFVFTLDDERGVRAFTPPADDTARPWRFVELEPVPGVLAAVAVPADAAQDPVLHLGYGFPWSRSELRSFPLPRPVGGRPAAALV
ncbi:4'-phosphopantetheinyl transferase superfamily protein [Streptomyces sp. NPDC004528]|uniref:4'-phosphopantetheinyl transferase family protein n=1 Tax=Streptomyces sp. NPDC004528 TaxID=3154550 RepID=UPI0033B495E0